MHNPDTAVPQPPGPSEPMPEAYSVIVESGDLFERMLALRDQYGDIVRIPTGTSQQVYLLNAAEDARSLLALPDEEAIRFPTRGSFLVGKGLVVSQGDFHRKQRRMIQPAFSTAALDSYVDGWVATAREQIERWRPGQTLDFYDEMTTITLRNVARSMFGTDVEDDVETIKRAIAQSIKIGFRPFTIHKGADTTTPPAAAAEAAAARKPLTDLIWRLIHERQASRRHGTDLLSRLLCAVDEADGSTMTEQQVFDEAVTLLNAGHGTVSLCLTWAGYLLARHSSAEQQVADEILTVLGNRPLTATDLPRMPHTENVTKETLRVYPPAWVIRRELLQPTTVRGYCLPAGAVVLTCPYILHRDPRYFTGPLQFRPERWTAQMESDLPTGAYLPFGAGRHGCIGWRYASLQARAVLPTVLQRWRLNLAPGQDVSPGPGRRSLSPDGPVNVKLTPRTDDHGKYTQAAAPRLSVELP
jgi:cytochrome P450